MQASSHSTAFRPSVRTLGLAVAGAVAVAAAFAQPTNQVLAQEEAERITIEIDGTAVHLPAADADLAAGLKSPITSFNTIRKYAAAREAKIIVANYLSNDLRENQWQLIDMLFAGRYPRDRFDTRYDEHCEGLKNITEQWREWAKGMGDLYFWEGDALKQFSHGENIFRFPQVHFAASGQTFSLHPPIFPSGYGIDAFDPDKMEPQTFRLDLPLNYKPGTPADEILRYPREFLRKLPELLQNTSSSLLTRRISTWLFENLAYDELQSHVFAESAQDGILPRAVARYIVALPNLFAEDAAKKKALADALSHIPGGNLETVEQLLADLEKADPLRPASDDSEAAEDLRFVCRNLVTLALLDTTISGKENTLFQRFEKEGIAFPENGFDHDAFIAAVHRVIDQDESDLDKKIEQLRQDRVALIRTQLDAIKLIEKKPEPAPEDKPTSIPPPPARSTSTFGDYEISHPEILAKVVAKVGPEVVENIAEARQLVIDAKSPKDQPTVEVSEEDSQSLTRYGLKSDLDTLQKWALGSATFMDLETPLKALLNSTRIQIWLKKELADYYESGGQVEGITFDPDTGKFSYNINFNSNIKLEDIESTEQVTEGFESDFEFVWPIILDLDANEVTAEKIREQASEFFDDETEVASEAPPSLDFEDLRLLGPEQVFFFAVHETVELQLIQTVISSNGRRWFCDGLANWIAIQECERRYGKGRGIEIFESMFPPDNYQPDADQVNLFAWPAVENLPSNPKYEHAHYYFATLALLAACEDQEPNFMKNWLTEIRKTPWKRTNNSHLLTAYEKLTGKDLRKIVEDVTKE